MSQVRLETIMALVIVRQSMELENAHAVTRQETPPHNPASVGLVNAQITEIQKSNR